eukprot:767712-Hanusia_phi.AAC.7
MAGGRGTEGRRRRVADALGTICGMLMVVSLSEGLGNAIGPFQTGHVPAQVKAMMVEANLSPKLLGCVGKGLNLRGGGIKARKRSASSKRKGSASRSHSLGGETRKKHMRKKQPAYNLPKDGLSLLDEVEDQALHSPTSKGVKRCKWEWLPSIREKVNALQLTSSRRMRPETYAANS